MNPVHESAVCRPGFDGIISQSHVMYSVFDQARLAAEAESTVLVTGESGTGKELIAEAIHRNSPRKSQPFVTINMAAVPENLIESELFGHTPGSFTGAVRERIGRFEAADGGTVFIDEIGDLGLTCQAKLLRVLENHCVTPVGGNDNRQVDVRVIAATNRNLERMIVAGDFREDLYYRLNVVRIALPPLRERRGDIPLLVRCFLEEMCRANHRPPLVPDGELMNFLARFDWPGNIRQLRNCIESMVVLARSETLTLEDLPDILQSRRRNGAADLDIPSTVTLEDIEEAALRQRLDHFDGNRTRAAESLGISVRTLQRGLKKWHNGENGWASDRRQSPLKDLEPALP